MSPSIAADSQFTKAWIPPILAYCSASIAMTLLNKVVLSAFKFKLPFMMLAVQSLASVALLEVFTFIKLVKKHRPLHKDDVRQWMPVSLMMAAMLYTGSKALQHLPVPIFTIFKNLSIILVAYTETTGQNYASLTESESAVFGGKVTRLMLVSFFLMALSSVLAASSDSHNSAFSLAGYFWMAINCCVSAGFVVTMRFTMRAMSNDRGPFRDFDSVFYNNLLTLPMFLVMSLSGADGNLSAFWAYYSDEANSAEWHRWSIAMALSGLSAFWISYSSSWCVRVTNSTTYSMVGALNKLPIAVAGLVMFDDVAVTVGSVGSIMLGFISGIIYTVAKLRYDKQTKEERQLLPVTLKSDSKHEA